MFSWCTSSSFAGVFFPTSSVKSFLPPETLRSVLSEVLELTCWIRLSSTSVRVLSLAVSNSDTPGSCSVTSPVVSSLCTTLPPSRSASFESMWFEPCVSLDGVDTVMVSMSSDTFSTSVPIGTLPFATIFSCFVPFSSSPTPFVSTSVSE